MQEPVRTTIRIDIPVAPKACSSNSGRGLSRHWTALREAKRTHREATKICAIAAGASNKRLTKAKISVIWRMGRLSQEKALQAAFKPYRPMDIQNAISALKAAVDGLVDARVIIDDSYKHLTWGEVTLLRTREEHQGVSGITLIIEGEK